MIISIASGKGGTGKTLVATSMAASLEGSTLLDCDVEAPNAHLFFPDKEILERREFFLPVPLVDEVKCDHCGDCSRFCAYNALAVFPGNVLVFPELCHGCGGCMLLCPRGAIREGYRSAGEILEARWEKGWLAWGQLNSGEARTAPLIKAVRDLADEGTVIVDCPPGASCSMVEAVRGTDFCLLVTEPTPFGLYDLKIACQVLKTMGIPHGVLINKAGIEFGAMEQEIRGLGIPVLMEIPMSLEIAELYSKGIVFVQERVEWAPRFRELLQKIEGMIR